MGYPETYGHPTKALPDIEGPLNIEHEGDKLVPDNDMAEIAGRFVTGGECPDPLGLLTFVEGKGKRK
jgi:hypothetical protein